MAAAFVTGDRLLGSPPTVFPSESRSSHFRLNLWRPGGSSWADEEIDAHEEIVGEQWLNVNQAAQFWTLMGGD